MARTDWYNPISEAVQITAISILVWAPVRKILAGTVQNHFHGLNYFRDGFLLANVHIEIMIS